MMDPFKTVMGGFIEKILFLSHFLLEIYLVLCCQKIIIYKVWCSLLSIPGDLADKSSSRDQPPFNPDGRKKFTRPLSCTGSRATSVKGEPGSALESNASATASLNKERLPGAQADKEQRGIVRARSNHQVGKRLLAVVSYLF